MSASAQTTASERVVFLLRPKEKRTLERLARKENISSAEVLRRSLAFYAELDAMAQSGKLAQAEAALDRTLSTIQSTAKRIEATLADIDERHRDPMYLEVQKRMDELMKQALTRRRATSRERKAGAWA